MKSSSTITLLAITIMVVVKCPHPDCDFHTDDLDAGVVASLWNIHALSHVPTAAGAGHSPAPTKPPPTKPPPSATVRARSPEAEVENCCFSVAIFCSRVQRRIAARNVPDGKKRKSSQAQETCCARLANGQKECAPYVQKVCALLAIVGWSVLVAGVFSHDWFIKYDGELLEGIFHCIHALGCDPWRVNTQAFAITSVAVGLLSVISLVFYIVLVKEGIAFMLYLCGVGFFLSGGFMQAAARIFWLKAQDVPTGGAPHYSADGGKLLLVVSLLLVALGIPHFQHFQRPRRRIKGFFKMNVTKPHVVVIQKHSTVTTDETYQSSPGTDEVDPSKHAESGESTKQDCPTDEKDSSKTGKTTKPVSWSEEKDSSKSGKSTKPVSWADEKDPSQTGKTIKPVHYYTSEKDTTKSWKSITTEIIHRSTPNTK